VIAARIRAATADDALAIAEVHVEGWAWGYRDLLPVEVIGAQTVVDRRAQWAKVLAQDPEREACLVAEADESIVGFVSFGPAEADEHEPPPNAGEVYALYLRETTKGTGVGGALLTEAVGRLREAGCPCAVLWVLETNERARRFYEHAGWVPDGLVASHRFECGDRPIVRYAVDL
jgi:GNAT superfamily N-acetyltransferase